MWEKELQQICTKRNTARVALRKTAKKVFCTAYREVRDAYGIVRKFSSATVQLIKFTFL